VDGTSFAARERKRALLGGELPGSCAQHMDAGGVHEADLRQIDDDGSRGVPHNMAQRVAKRRDGADIDLTAAADHIDAALALVSHDEQGPPSSSLSGNVPWLPARASRGVPGTPASQRAACQLSWSSTCLYLMGPPQIIGDLKHGRNLNAEVMLTSCRAFVNDDWRQNTKRACFAADRGALPRRLLR
jgi:hypothetical protein